MTARSGATQDEVRRHNLSAMLEHLHRHGPATRAELTSLLGLNRSTTAALVADLAARRLVVETDRVPGPRRTGRPSSLVRPCENAAVALALEFEVDSIGVAVVGLGGTVLAQVRAAYPAEAPPAAEAVTLACRHARRVLASLPAHAWLAGVGVGVAGIVRRGDGLVHFAPNLGWHDVPLRDLVAARLRLDVDVVVGNDANLGAIAEHLRGAGRDVDDLVYVSSEVGVGLGFVTGGRLQPGADGYLGEFGHLPLFPRGRRCRCGAQGCWETEVGTKSLLRRARRDEDEGLTGVREVLAAAAAGDPVCRRAVDSVADRLGVGLAAVVNALNPRLVVLGGFFGELWPLGADRVRASMAAHALPAAADTVCVVPAELRDNSMLLGAAETVLAAVVSDPTLVPVAVAS